MKWESQEGIHSFIQLVEKLHMLKTLLSMFDFIVWSVASYLDLDIYNLSQLFFYQQ